MDILREFYRAATPGSGVKKFHIPHSRVFYIRAALRERTGVEYELEHIERVLKELPPEPKKTDVIPEWYRKKWFK